MHNPETKSLVSIIESRATAWNAAELADLLSISQKHIYKLAKAGRMPSLRIGGAIRFDPKTTADWLRSKEIE